MKGVEEEERERKEREEKTATGVAGGSSGISHPDCQPAFQFPLVGERVEWDRSVLCERTLAKISLSLSLFFSSRRRSRLCTRIRQISATKGQEEVENPVTATKRHRVGTERGGQGEGATQVYRGN